VTSDNSSPVAGQGNDHGDKTLQSVRLTSAATPRTAESERAVKVGADQIAPEDLADSSNSLDAIGELLAVHFRRHSTTLAQATVRRSVSLSGCGVRGAAHVFESAGDGKSDHDRTFGQTLGESERSDDVRARPGLPD
jgi:hypothetical protein